MTKKTMIKTLILFICLCATIFIPSRIVNAAPSIETEDFSPVRDDCNLPNSKILRPEDLPSDGPIGSPDQYVTGEVKASSIDSVADMETYIPLVVITIGFKNISYEDDYDWHKVLFEEERSLSQYYKDMSFNKFTFLPVQEKSAYGTDGNTNTKDQVNDGIIHITLDESKTSLWTGTSITTDTTIYRNSLIEALKKAGKYIDFASFDSNKNGDIQPSELAILFIISGVEYSVSQKYANEDNEYLFTHANKGWFARQYGQGENQFFGSPAEINGIKFYDFTMCAEKFIYKDEEQPLFIGVIAHELGHHLGLPDFYANYSYITGWENYDSLYVTLMNTGCYGKDLEGNPCPYSLDIWSRVRLGWVEPLQVGTTDDAKDNIWSLGGTLDPSSENPVAVRLNTAREGEYYLLENRRFSSWDEGLARKYPNAVKEGGEDYGGGILIWHIDNDLYETYGKAIIDGQHPAVMPLFIEKKDGVKTMIGTEIDVKSPFFTPDTWEGDLFLPMYGDDEKDVPSDRVYAANLVLSIDSENAPVMKMHRHTIGKTFYHWADDYSSVSCWGICSQCHKQVDLETTSDIHAKELTKPSSTESGTIQYTARFRMYGLGDKTLEREIPPLDSPAAGERSIAFIELEEMITGAEEILTGNTKYTEESTKALSDAISAAKAILQDEKATDETAKEAQTTLVNAWTLLEIDPSSGESGSGNESGNGSGNESGNGSGNQSGSESGNESGNGSGNQSGSESGNESGNGSDSQNTASGKISIANASVTGIKSVDYTGKEIKPEPIISLNGKSLKKGTDYTVSYKNNTNAGKATVIITGINNYTGTIKNDFTIRKVNQTLNVKAAKRKTVKSGKLKKGKKVISEAITVKNAKGEVTYTKVSGSKKLSINKKTGKVTIKKKTGKGIYKMKVRVTATGDANYNAANETVKVTVKVK